MFDKRKIDGTKIYLHPERVAQWRAALTWDEAKLVAPIYAEITTCAACNHRCTFCSVDAIGYPQIMFSAGVLHERMLEMAGMGVKSVMFAGTGEPLLHTKINTITVDAYCAGLDVAFTTNGVLLNKLQAIDKCSWVKVSLNAGTKETYAAVHQTQAKDWDTVWRNIADAAKRKGDCALGVQAVLLPENRNEMFALAHRARDAGADYLVVKPYSQGTFSLTHKYEGVDYSGDQRLADALATANTDSFQVIYRAESMKQESEAHHYDKCRATPVFWVYAKADGDVFTCSAHLMDERFCIGNLNRQTFKEIWHGDKRRQNWELMQSFDITQCRSNCRMNASNKYLAEFDTVAHANFI